MEKQELKKNLGVMSAMSIVVGCVIGAGVFFKPYAIYQATGGAPGMGMLSWIIGGVASILGALTFAEVAVLIPKTGGMVTYLGEVYNDKIGFLAGWMQVIIFYPAFLAGYGVRVGQELAEYVGSQYALPIGMAVIIILVAINTLGNKTASGVQIVSTICKLIPLVLLMIFGFILGEGGHPIFTPMVGNDPATGAQLSTGAVLGQTLIAVLFAFEGWTNVGAIAGEMKNPGRDLPRAIVGGVSIIMAVYFIIGAANGFLLSGSRVAYYLGETQSIPFSGAFAKLNKNSVPTNSIILVGFLGCLYSITQQFDMLTDLAVFSCWIFYTLTFACVMTLRRKQPNLDRKYKVPLYPVIPILAIVSGLYVMVSQLFLSGTKATLLSLGSIAVTLIGLPIYILTRKHYAKKA